jgi:hypothetical protein
VKIVLKKPRCIFESLDCKATLKVILEENAEKIRGIIFGRGIFENSFCLSNLPVFGQ